MPIQYGCSKKAKVAQQPQTTTDSDTTYHGKTSDGRFRVKRNGQTFHVSGQMFKASKELQDSDVKKHEEKPIATTLGYVASETDERFLAQGHKTGKWYWIVGQVIATSKAPTPTEPREPMPPHPIAEQSALCASKALTKPRRHSKPQLSFEEQMKQLSDMRLAGLDPDVRMNFIVTYLHESKANLYRKCGTSFPRPVKRGKSSFWPLSQIEAYKKGANSGVEA